MARGAGRAADDAEDASEERRTDDPRGDQGAEELEDELKSSFDGIVSEGADRLQRTWRTTVITGFFGGIEVGLGVIAYLAVLHATGQHLLAGIAFGIGFIALYLAHSELFTENFLLPITALVSRDGTIGQLARLWLGTLVANLVGGWLMMWLVLQAFPEFDGEVAEAAHHFVDPGLTLRTAVLAALGGMVITLLTRMHNGTEDDTAKLIASVAAGFLLAGLQLFHSILDSLFIFGAIQSGADVDYLDWLGWFAYTIVFNIVGGVLLVTLLRLVRTKELVQRERREG